jgi:nucleoside-diphosphate-sugar epimerase
VYGASAATVSVMDENSLRPAPVNLYGMTKFAAELILARGAETQDIPFTAARLGVVYGPWEYATGVRDTLSPMLQTLDLAELGETVVLDSPWRGDYMLSRDIATGLVTLANMASTPRGFYNLATGRGIVSMSAGGGG